MTPNGHRTLSLVFVASLVPSSCGDQDPVSPTLTGASTSGTEDTSMMVPTDTSADTSAGPTSTSSDVGGTEASTSAPVTSTTAGDSTTGPQGDPSIKVINFDDLSQATAVTDQYEYAVFSSVDNCNALAINAAKAYGTSPPFNIHVSNKVNYDCHGKAPLTIDFLLPAYDLSFIVAAIEEIGVTSHVQVFQLGVETAVVDIVGVGDVYALTPIDLGEYPGITRIVIAEEPSGGNFGHFYDDFTFTVFE